MKLNLNIYIEYEFYIHFKCKFHASQMIIKCKFLIKRTNLDNAY